MLLFVGRKIKIFFSTAPIIIQFSLWELALESTELALVTESIDSILIVWADKGSIRIDGTTEGSNGWRGLASINVELLFKSNSITFVKPSISKVNEIAVGITL